MPDAVVIGSGPNGIAGAAALALRGWDVLLLEAKSRPGGALYSEPFTLPGFVHDVGAAFFPFADLSPVFRTLDLSGAGLQWRNAAIESCHPAPDGTCASISRDVERSARSFGVDGDAWRKLAQWMAGMSDRLANALLTPLPAFGPAWRLGLGNILKFSIAGMQTTAFWSKHTFRTEAARRIVPGLALHVDLGPEDFAGAGLGLVLALLASASGFRVPVGGARAITEAMLQRFERAGGRLRLNTHVERIVVREGRAVAVRTDDGTEIDVRHAVLADVGPAALFLKMLDEEAVPGGLRVKAREFRYGWGTFKMDWALSGPVPWTAPKGARRPSSTPATASTISSPSPTRCAAANCPTIPIWSSASSRWSMRRGRRRAATRYGRIRACHRGCRAAGRPCASPSPTASTLASRGWHRGFARSSRAGPFMRRPTSKPWMKTSSAAISAAAAPRSNSNSSCAPSSPTSATARRFAAFTWHRLRRIPAPASTRLRVERRADGVLATWEREHLARSTPWTVRRVYPQSRRDGGPCLTCDNVPQGLSSPPARGAKGRVGEWCGLLTTCPRHPFGIAAKRG